MIFSTIKQHVLGVLGQASAALPILLVVIYVSQESGLAAVGEFSVFAAVSSIIFATSLWGLRSLVVIDKFHRFSFDSFLSLRVVTIIAMSVTIFWVAREGNIHFGLVTAVIFIRASDTLIDTRMAYDQAINESSTVFRNYSQAQVLKLSLVLFPLAYGYLFLEPQQTYWNIGFASIIAFLINAKQILKTRHNANSDIQATLRTQVFGLIGGAKWFALAAFVCAFMTNSPRANLGNLFSGEQLGVIGGVLALSTLFGMVFNVTWIRALPRLSDKRTQSKAFRIFLYENLTLFVSLLISNVLIVRHLTPIILGYDHSAFGLLPFWTMTASVFFFFGQIFCNLFKLTSKRWLETAAYAVGFVVLFCTTAISPDERGLILSLIMSGSSMAIFSAVYYWFEIKNSKVEIANVK